MRANNAQRVFDEAIEKKDLWQEKLSASEDELSNYERIEREQKLQYAQREEPTRNLPSESTIRKKISSLNDEIKEKDKVIARLNQEKNRIGQ